MKARTVLLFLFLCAAAGPVTRVAAKLKFGRSEYFKLVEAYKQRTNPGRWEGLPHPATKFIIVWESKKQIESFFWKTPEGAWQSCNISKARKNATPGDIPPGMDYLTDAVKPEQIEKGDTLMITATAGGKFPIPEVAATDGNGNLYFKAGGSDWIKFHVDSIGRKHDVITP
jgi:hypothetical protein